MALHRSFTTAALKLATKRLTIMHLQVAEVRYNARLQYLLVVLQDALTQRQMEQLCPDINQAHRASSGGDILGVIVAAQASGVGPHGHVDDLLPPMRAVLA